MLAHIQQSTSRVTDLFQQLVLALGCRESVKERKMKND